MSRPTILPNWLSAILSWIRPLAVRHPFFACHDIWGSVLRDSDLFLFQRSSGRLLPLQRVEVGSTLYAQIPWLTLTLGVIIRSLFLHSDRTNDGRRNCFRHFQRIRRHRCFIPTPIPQCCTVRWLAWGRFKRTTSSLGLSTFVLFDTNNSRGNFKGIVESTFCV